MRSVQRAGLVRELRLAGGRTLAMVVAVAAGTIAVGTAVGAYAVLSREIARSYRETVPASATFEVDGLDRRLIEAVRARPEVAVAEARATRLFRIEVPEGTRRLLLFAIDDFDAMGLARVTPDTGAWPPGEGELLLERSSLRVLDVEVGDALSLLIPGGRRPLRFAGTVHDPGLAPAWMEMTAYGYASPETLAQLDGSALDELRVVFADADHADVGRIDAEARALAAWLAERGTPAHEIRVPPPRMHPHESQMRTILVMLAAFGAVTIVLAAILVATITVARMAARTREVGVMKAIGARSWQIARPALATIGVVGAAAAAVAIPIARLGAGLFADRISSMLNFELEDASIPWWVPATQLVSAVLVPMAIAWAPIRRAAAVPVRRALDANEGGPVFGAGRLEAAAAKLSAGRAAWSLALRNVVRRRAWLTATVTKLAIGGAVFVTAIEIGEGWRAWAEEVAATRHDDVEVRLRDGAAEEAARYALAGMPEITALESWGIMPVTVADPSGHAIERTYPDGGHGAFRALAPPPEAGLVELPVIAGTWLDGAAGHVVLDELAARRTHADVGHDVAFSIEGRSVSWRVVGVVHVVGTPATAYVSPETLETATRGSHGVLLRVAAGGTHGAAERVERRLDEAGVPLDDVVGREMLRTAVGDHVGILRAALVALALVVLLVGVIGLGASTATSIVERSRELGVLRAIGATRRFVVRSLVAEGAVVGVVSAALGVLLSLVFSLVLGGVLGRMTFGSPLPLVVSAGAMLGWTALVLVLGAGAAAIPARWALRSSTRELLAR